MGQRCNDSVGQPAGTRSRSRRWSPPGLCCLVCMVWARNWRVEGLKAGEFLPNFTSFPETPSQREGRRLYLRLESSLEDPRRLAKAWLVGPDAYQAGQAQIGGLTKGAFSGSDRVGMAARRPGEGAVGVAVCSQAAKQPSQARREGQAQALAAACPACRHSVAGGQVGKEMQPS